MKPENIRFFDSAADFRAWLADNHATAPFQWVGFYKKAAGPRGMTYDEAVGEALCFGWIDGQTNRVDELRVTTRFSPRRARSIWSTANVKRVAELTRAGLMQPAGLAVFEARKPELTGIYVSDMDADVLPAELLEPLRANGSAWQSWSKSPPGYRRQMMWWVLSAKRDETRQRRLAALIGEHAAGRRVDPLHLPKATQS